MNKMYTAYYESPIGLIKITATNHHVSSISFVDKPENVIVEEPSINKVVEKSIEELTSYFNGQSRTFNVAINQQGTPFQNRVWNELLNINYGKTISYLTLAKRLGDPKCIRAAAAGNGKNNICIIVPCHRVIGSNNSLVGFVGGLWRKKWLLEHESKFANGLQTMF